MLMQELKRETFGNIIRRNKRNGLSITIQIPNKRNKITN